MSERLYRLPTAWGGFLAGFTDMGLSRLEFPRVRGRANGVPLLRASSEPAASKLIASLRRYIAGGSGKFELPLDLSRGTAFQRRVWRALMRVPRGRTVTYENLARMAGSPRAARAAGSACGANPVAVVVPCHRAVASDGIGGFGAGLRWKRRLLELEGAAECGPERSRSRKGGGR